MSHMVNGELEYRSSIMEDRKTDGMVVKDIFQRSYPQKVCKKRKAVSILSG